MPIFTIQSRRVIATSVEKKYAYLGFSFAYGDCKLY
ncbi:hypothetical protein C21_02929 [Arenibacter sp. NBRC 103722]|nr:hypothetical protein C21_02929 [Arenibacter sp. NBRC 103722]